jgi:hypothetical protein
VLVQLRFKCSLSSEEYVTSKAWRLAILHRCPLHPNGGCQFSRHSTYKRKHPPGAEVARYYCRDGHQTFSLLPDCLAARLPGTLVEVEETVVARERGTVAAAAEAVRPAEAAEAVGLTSAMRWVQRRVVLVRAALSALIALMPDRFGLCQPTIESFRLQLSVELVLPALRELAADWLISLPPPVGFGPHPNRRKSRRLRHQQRAGPDPPPLLQ